MLKVRQGNNSFLNLYPRWYSDISPALDSSVIPAPKWPTFGGGGVSNGGRRTRGRIHLILNIIHFLWSIIFSTGRYKRFGAKIR